MLTPPCIVAATDTDPIPNCVQKVRDKHSVAGGTLCGKIPANTHAKGYECKIELVPGAHPVCIRQYRLTPLEKAELLTQVDAFIEKGWIEPSASSWSSSVFFVPKPNNKLRFCVDFRQLNQRTVTDSGNIPLTGELLDSLSGAKLFSALDLASGYYQLAMAPGSREVTAFPTPYGLYQWRVMPMGLCNAPAVFQKAMNEILRDHIRAGYCLVYLDDIIIMSKTAQEHAAHVDAVLTSLNAHNLFCQLPKCFWARPELKYLGHIVSGEGVKPDPAKVGSLDGWNPPWQHIEVLRKESNVAVQTASRKQIVHECRRFLGFMNYFNRFIPRYADLAACLHEQTCDNAPAWSTECSEAWKLMKDILCKATMMHHPNESKPFHVFSDASIRAIGGALMQEIDGELAPIAYCARKLSPAEVNYSTTEQEMLGMVYCFQQWRCYLEGAQTGTLLHTDHEPLTWLHQQARPNRRQARWLEFLSRFDYKVLYVKGDENVVADALTRMLEVGETVPEALPCETWPVDEGRIELNVSRTPATVHGSDGARPRTGGRAESGTPCAPAAGGSHHGATQVVPPGGRPRGTCSATGRRGAQQSARRTSAGSQHGGPSILAFVRIGVAGYTRRTATRSAPEGTSAGEATDTGTDSHPTVITDVSRKARNVVQRFKTKSLKELGRRSPLIKKAPVPRHRGKSGSRHRYPGSNANPEPVPTDTASLNPCPAVPEAVTSNPLENTEAIPSFDRVSPSERIDENADGVDYSLNQAERLFDELFERIRGLLVSDSATQTEKQRTELALESRHGMLWRGKLLYIPDNMRLRHDILYWHHDVPWCAHLGIEKTLELVKRQFYWPGLDGDIREYIRTCHKCQANKVNRGVTRPPLTPLPTPESCWKVLGVDLIVDLPCTAGDEYNAICVFVCHLSKMVRLVPTRTTLTTEGFAKLFVREVFTHYGMPHTIISDRGTQWNSEFFRALCDILGIKLKMSTAYHPQTNGMVERTNEVVAAALRHYVQADHRNWDAKLPLIEFALNCAYHKSLGSTPFRMNRITLPSNPFEVLLDQRVITSELSSTVGISSLHPSAVRTASEAHSDFQWARRCVHLAKSRMKESHDERHNLKVTLHDAGQLVWLNVKNLALRHPSLRHKMVPKYIGPLKILEVVGRSAVRLDMPETLKIHPTVSVSLIKPYFPRDNVPVPPVLIEGELEWEIHGISNHNILRSRRKYGMNLVEFCVNWKESYEDSWHEIVDFENSLDSLEQYLRNQCTRGVRLQILKVLKPEERLLLSADLRAEAGA